jgi:hydrogenase/urease accessory protein HupE
MDKFKSRIVGVSRHVIDSIKLIFIAFASVYLLGGLGAIVRNMEIPEYAKAILIVILTMGPILIILDELLKMTDGKRD